MSSATISPLCVAFTGSCPTSSTYSATAGTASVYGLFTGTAGGKLLAIDLGTGNVGWEGNVATPKGATELERIADVTSLPLVEERQACALAQETARNTAEAELRKHAPDAIVITGWHTWPLVQLLRAAGRLLMKSLDHSRAATITIESDDGSSPSVSVPPQVLKVLGQTLGLMARRQPIALVHEKQELSTVEAANYLNVSRPFVIKEIQSGRLPCRLVGTHRRILFEDLLQYSAKMQAKRQEALDKMAADARELGLEY